MLTYNKGEMILNSTMIDKYIRAMSEKRLIDFSNHAIQRMGERKIEVEQVLECLKSGKIIEHQDHGQDIKVLFHTSNENESGFYVVVALADPYPLVVTVCNVKNEAWEYRDDFIKRRKKK